VPTAVVPFYGSRARGMTSERAPSVITPVVDSTRPTVGCRINEAKDRVSTVVSRNGVVRLWWPLAQGRALSGRADERVRIVIPPR
jgi:hypothetical protein